MPRPPSRRIDTGPVRGPATGQAVLGTDLTGPGLVLDRVRDRVPRFEIDPKLLEPLKREAAPLLLLPLRLEYRLVDGAHPPIVAERADLALRRADIDTRHQAGSAGAPGRRAAAVADLRRDRLRDFTPKPVQPEGGRALWVRWYPDADFAQAGVPAVTADESAAVQAFRAVAAANWWALPDAATAGAWAALVATCGPARALYLARGGTGGDPAAIGRITALPRRVVLFALTGGTIEEVAAGSAIPPNTGAGPVGYTPDAIDAGGWLSDFGIAVAQGMGVRITDPAAIDRALKADWIAAVGLADGDARPEISALLADGIAGGGFAMLSPDTPTNNSPGARSPQRHWRDDAQGFLRAATEAEQGRHDGHSLRAADLLAEALDLDPALTRTAIGGADTAFADATAMMRVIAPGMLDGVYDGTVWGQDIDENDVIDIVAGAIAARGALPAVQIGRNPYGIVTLTRAAEADPAADPLFSKAEQTVFGILHRLAQTMRPFGVATADRAAPRLRPDAPSETAAALEAILQNAPASRRIEVMDDTGTLQAIGCPYVVGQKPEHQPLAYLTDLRRKRPADLPDPDDSDRRWPLLYRLARLTLTRNLVYVLSKGELAPVPSRVEAFEALPKEERDQAFERFDAFAGELGLTIGRGADRRAGRSAPSRIQTQTALLAQRLFGAFDAGLARLAEIAARPNGTAELEDLMFEVFDTLQHRTDAWLTGIAHARLTRRRAAGVQGLSAGYWGLLGRLRASDKLARDDGYIQAPGLAQATTAAVLRSAYRRHGDGAFNLDLSSGRVRRGMAILDLLSSGAPLAVAMGLRAERALRDARPKGLSHLIPGLRQDFPLRNDHPPETEADPAAPSGRSGAPMLDGLALIAATPTRFAAADRPALVAILSRLSDDLDAVADIVMAEAAHHRALGAAETANAWLSVLSGGTLPGRPVFLRTDRKRQASSHRVILVLPEPRPGDPVSDSPRALADPGLAALAQALVPDAGDLTVEVTASLVADSTRAASLILDTGKSLGMQAIDLLIGGDSELSVRARAAFAARWHGGDPALAALDPLPEGVRPEDVVLLAVKPEAALTAALARLQALRSCVGQGRALGPGDLNAAADAAAGLLGDGAEAALTAGALADLDRRVDRVSVALRMASAAYNAALQAAMSRLMQIQVELDRDPASAAAAQAWTRAKAAVEALAATLPRVAAFGEPTLLRHLSVARLLAPGDDGLVRLAAGKRRLQAKVNLLGSVLGQPVGADLPAARAALAARTEALQTVLDGPALPVLPVWAQTPGTTPVVDAAVGFPAAGQVLHDWAAVRRQIAALTAALGPAPKGIDLYPVAAVATGTDEDPRAAAVAPRSLHFGLFLADRNPARSAFLSGFIVDDWTETRASTQQDAAIAINYNTPNAQAPNAMLLCMPPSDAWKAWTEMRAAAMVAEATDLMRLRALTSDQRPLPVAFAPGGNSVPRPSGGAARIPERNLILTDFVHDISGAGLFVSGLARPGDLVGVSGSGLNLSPGRALKED